MNADIKKLFIESLEDSSISEIETNGTSSFFVVRNGTRQEYKNIFKDLKEYFEFITWIGQNMDNSLTELPKNILEGRMVLSSSVLARVHIVLPPASQLPSMTIAKKTNSLKTLESIQKTGSMTVKMCQFLKMAVECKLNIVLSGASGAGKTTMLEALAKNIEELERIGVVEDSPELRLSQANTVYLQSKPWQPGQDKKDEVPLDWCVRQLNRMRCDRVILGECRGKEFKEFITLANSGLDGSMTTLHANTPKLALNKMTQFIMEANEAPIRIINKSIANTIDLIIQLKKIDGKYICTNIEEVSQIVGADEGAEIATASLAKYDEDTKSFKETFMFSDSLRNKILANGYSITGFGKV